MTSRPSAPLSKPLRVVSLIPSATEIVYALGFESALVGRSHECDFPPSVQSLPVCTQPRVELSGASLDIHNQVTELLQAALSVYEVDLSQIGDVQPTHIITQAQCEVCAASLEDVQKAAATQLACAPKILSLQPQVLADVWEDLRQVAIALDPKHGPARAERTIIALQQRLQKVHKPQKQTPTVVCLEWTDPLMAAGNWIPELITLAGGHPVFGRVGQHSPWLQWEDLLAADPDVIIVMPCGYDLAQTQEATQLLSQDTRWQTLKAVRNYRVYVTDGNQYFNRPGPRLVDSLEILSEILQPDTYGFEDASRYAMKAWKLFSL